MAIHLIDYDKESLSMTFRIDGVEKDITVSLYPNNAGIAIDYGDDGVGIPFRDADWMKEFIEDKELGKRLIEEANKNLTEEEEKRMKKKLIFLGDETEPDAE
jgi:hypothetical protein